MSVPVETRVPSQEAPERAISEIPALLRHDPYNLTGWIALFKASIYVGDISEALCLARALMPKVSNPADLFLHVGRLLQGHGLHEAAVDIYERILACQPDARQVCSELLIHKQIFENDDDDLDRAYRSWNGRFVVPLLKGCKPAVTSPDIDRPLRIGFVSNDFGGNHSLNAVMAPWFLFRERRSNFYSFYSNGPRNVTVHKLFAEAGDVFTDVSTLSDEELASKIRSDRIDILVDMIGHAARNRLLVYARKPTPIIVSWVAVGMPTGIEAVDYFLADEYRVPRESVTRYCEKIAYLPHTAMVWCPPKSAPAIEPEGSLRRNRIVFGNLARIVKFREETIELWARVLHRVPDSMFMFKDSHLVGGNVSRILTMFQNHGIGPERFIFRTQTNQAEHLATYNEVDIVLDSYPEPGGISSLEALWMGVPIVPYCHSKRPSGRVGRNFLENLGLPAMVADTQDMYVDLAETLAQNRERLVLFRRALRQRMARSPLCDVAMFQRNVTLAFSHMWKRHCGNLPPETFTVGLS